MSKEVQSAHPLAPLIFATQQERRDFILHVLLGSISS